MIRDLIRDIFLPTGRSLGIINEEFIDGKGKRVPINSVCHKCSLLVNNSGFRLTIKNSVGEGLKGHLKYVFYHPKCFKQDKKWKNDKINSHFN